MTGALRLAGSIALAASLVAPLQCPRSHPVEHRIEDDPAEVLYTLAEKFKAAGNASARTDTLRFLIARYPVSRFATAARLDLGEAVPMGNPAGVPQTPPVGELAR